MNTPVIEVRIWGKRVGAVAYDHGLGAHVFAYDPAWRRGGIELAPLTMPIAGHPDGVVSFTNLPRATYNGLPGLLADALPDDFGNALIDAWMSSRGVDKNSVTVLDRLAYMGKRGMGALEFMPALKTANMSRASSEPLQMRDMVDAARQVIRGDFDKSNGDDHAQAALQNIISTGTSAGGARAKAVIAWDPKTEEIRSGQFDVAPGFEHWLLKFDGVGKDKELGTGADYGRIEYAYYLMAMAAGIEMMPSRLLEENGRAHFMTKRFDRDNNTKHHVQTLCGMDHIDYKQRGTNAYEQFFMSIKKLDLGDDANSQAFRRMVLNVLARNCDDHTKNIAFRLKQGGSWELAPAYDVTHAYNPEGEWTYQHLMSVNGRFSGIADEDFMVIADRFGIIKPADIIADVRSAVASWAELAKVAGLGDQTIDRVAADFPGAGSSTQATPPPHP